MDMNNNVGYALPEVRRCMGYEKLGCAEIRLPDPDSFISRAKKLRPDTIWSCYGPMCNKFKTADGKSPDFEWEKPNPNIFFFVKENGIYSAESEGFELLGEYLNAKKTGFLQTKAYELRNCASKKYGNISVASLYYQAKQYGYTNFDEFNLSYRFYNDFKPADEFRKEKYIITDLGFNKKSDWECAKNRGFKESKDYYDAISEDIEFYCDYKDFKVLSKLSEKGEEYGFSPPYSPYKLHIFHIINRLRGGQAIKLIDLYRKLRQESYYYNKDWYGDARENIYIDSIKEILRDKPFSNLGKIIGDSDNAVYSLYRNDTIFVDGSNIAWNNCSKRRGDIPYAKNIKAVVLKLEEIGFKNVRVICDSNLYYIIEDKDIYKELSNMEVIDVVRAYSTADSWLLQFKDGKDRFIVSNDMFSEYLEQYQDLENHRIGFQVSGDEATFDEKIYEVVDGYLPINELPRLCRQSDNA